jgi:hypothetical protein
MEEVSSFSKLLLDGVFGDKDLTIRQLVSKFLKAGNPTASLFTETEDGDALCIVFARGERAREVNRVVGVKPEERPDPEDEEEPPRK